VSQSVLQIRACVQLRRMANSTPAGKGEFVVTCGDSAESLALGALLRGAVAKLRSRLSRRIPADRRGSGSRHTLPSDCIRRARRHGCACAGAVIDQGLCGGVGGRPIWDASGHPSSLPGRTTDLTAVGLWEQVDDRTGRTQSWFKITERGGVYER
jgi:hypothetical protein